MFLSVAWNLVLLLPRGWRPSPGVLLQCPADTCRSVVTGVPDSARGAWFCMSWAGISCPGGRAVALAHSKVSLLRHSEGHVSRTRSVAEPAMHMSPYGRAMCAGALSIEQDQPRHQGWFRAVNGWWDFWSGCCTHCHSHSQIAGRSDRVQAHGTPCGEGVTGDRDQPCGQHAHWGAGERKDLRKAAGDRPLWAGWLGTWDTGGTAVHVGR